MYSEEDYDGACTDWRARSPNWVSVQLNSKYTNAAKRIQSYIKLPEPQSREDILSPKPNSQSPLQAKVCKPSSLRTSRRCVSSFQTPQTRGRRCTEYFKAPQALHHPTYPSNRLQRLTHIQKTLEASSAPSALPRVTGSISQLSRRGLWKEALAARQAASRLRG